MGAPNLNHKVSPGTMATQAQAGSHSNSDSTVTSAEKKVIFASSLGRSLNGMTSIYMVHWQRPSVSSFFLE